MHPMQQQHGRFLYVDKSDYRGSSCWLMCIGSQE